MNWSNNDLDIYIKRNPRSHLNYSSDKKIMNKLLNYFRKLSPNIRKKLRIFWRLKPSKTNMKNINNLYLMK